MQQIIDDYDNGRITSTQALRALCNDLGECADEQITLDTQHKQLRAAIERIVLKEGTTEVQGFGRLMMVAPSTTNKYDVKRLDALVLTLMQVGEHDIAAQIAECRTEGVRAGYLKIDREKR